MQGLSSGIEHRRLLPPQHTNLFALSANGMLLASYPVYDLVETAIAKRQRRSVHPALRCGLRVSYVSLTWVVALLIPFFGALFVVAMVDF
jgi:hypothetical protein